MIKQYSKNEYYRSKNLPLPKACHRLPIQPPVRVYLIDPIPSIVSDVKKCLQNKALQNEINVQLIQYEKVVHELQIENQTLRLNLNEKDQELSRRKNQKETDQRRVLFLEKQVFSLQNHIQKIQYEAKVNYQGAVRQFDLVKNDYELKTNEIEIITSNLKINYQKELELIKKNYQKRIQSYQNDKNQLKQTSSQNFQTLKKQMEKLNLENKRLKNQLIISQSENIQKFRFLQQQNFYLKDRLANIQIQQKLQAIKLNIELQSKNSQIQQIKVEVQRLLKLLENQKERHAYQKDYIKKAKIQFQNQWKNKLNQAEQVINSSSNKIYEITKKLEILKQQQEINGKKLTFCQQQNEICKRKNKQIEQEYKQKLIRNQNLNNQTKQNQILLVKESFNKRIEFFQMQSKQNNDQLTRLIKANDILKKEIQELKYQKINSQRKLRELEITLQSSEYEKDKGNLMINYLKQKIQTIQKEKENQIRQIKDSIEFQKESEINRIIQESKESANQLIVKYRGQILKLQYQNEENNKQYKNNLRKMQAKIQNLQSQKRKINCQLQTMSQKLLSSSQMQNQQRQTYQIKILQFENINHKIQEELVINQQKNFKLQSQNLNLKVQIENCNQALKSSQQRQKCLKDKLKEQDNIRIAQIRKSSQKQQQYITNLKKEEESKLQLIKSYKKLENQVFHLKIKNQNSQQQISVLSKQRQIYIAQVNKLKSSLINSQNSSNILLSQINYNYNQIVGKLEGGLKQKNQQLNQKNQQLLKEIVFITSQKQQLFVKCSQLSLQKDILKTQIKEKKTYIQQIQQKLLQKQQILKKLQTLLNQKQVKIKSLTLLHSQSEHQYKKISQKLIKHQESIKKMKKSVSLQSEEVNNQKFRYKQIQNHYLTLKQEFQTLKKQRSLEQQKCLQFKLKLQCLQNQNYQLKEQIQVNNKRQKAKNSFYQQNIQKIQGQLDQKKKQLEQKQLNSDKFLFAKQKQAQNLQAKLNEQSLLFQKQLQKREKIIKSKSEQINYLLSQIQLVKTDFDAYTKELQTKLQQKDSQIKKMQKNRMKDSSIFQDLQTKNSELQVRNALLIQKLEIQTNKFQKLKEKLNHCERKCSLFEEQKQNCRAQLEILKRKVQKFEFQQEQKAELYKEQIKRITQQLQSQNFKIIKQQRQKYQIKINELRLLYQDQTKLKNNLKIDLVQHKKNQANIKCFYEQQLKNMEKKLIILNKKIIFYMEFKRRWDRLSGQVRQYSNMDYNEPSEDNEFNFYISRTQKNDFSSYSQDKVVQQVSSQNGKDKNSQKNYHIYNFDFSYQVSPHSLKREEDKQLNKFSPQKNFKKNQKETPQTKESKMVKKVNQSSQMNKKNSQKLFQYVNERQLLANNYQHIYSSQQFQNNKRFFEIQKYLQSRRSQTEQKKQKFTEEQLKKIRNMRYNQSDEDITYPKPLGQMSFKQQHRVTNKRLISKVVNGQQVKKFFWTTHQLEPTIKSSWISSTQWEKKKQDFDCKNIEEKTNSKIKQVISQKCSNQNSKNSNSLE